MKLTQSLALVTIMLVATVNPANGAIKNGLELLNQCSDPDRLVGLSLCLGYITGIADASICGQDVVGFSWKPPVGGTAGQLEKIVTKWLKDHPETLHFAARGLVANALQDAFPCN